MLPAYGANPTPMAFSQLAAEVEGNAEPVEQALADGR
jgi:hypothetical protein